MTTHNDPDERPGSDPWPDGPLVNLDECDEILDELYGPVFGTPACTCSFPLVNGTTQRHICPACQAAADLNHPAIVRKAITLWHQDRPACARWLATFSTADRRQLAAAVVAYRKQFYPASELTAEQQLAAWEQAIADLLPPRPAAALRAA